MLDGESLQPFIEDAKTMGALVQEDPTLLDHVVSFGPIAGISETLRRQEAHVREHSAPAEFAKLRAPEVTYLSILKELGVLRLPPEDRQIFIEYFHPYYHQLYEDERLNESGSELLTRRGLPELDEAFILGNQLHEFMENFGVNATRMVFVDSVTQGESSTVLDAASKEGMILTQVKLPMGISMYDSRVNGSMTGVRVKEDKVGTFFDAQINESELISDGESLAVAIAEQARKKGYRVQGTRGKVHFNDHEGVFLYDKVGNPSCEVLDLAYRRLLTWDNNTGLNPFHGGVIVLPESFRRQQERVRRLNQLMGWNQNIVTVLQD
ncbi:MAG: hypothetical protein UZ22_OP11002000725 [Microgenomates bacterium OLB23]|nr:MAG: hypothetical protein UZ22_OP11002000725 [Microgenomates bacterium OLB23]